jgi:hypothetical protein
MRTNETELAPNVGLRRNLRRVDLMGIVSLSLAVATIPVAAGDVSNAAAKEDSAAIRSFQVNAGP